MDPRNATMNFTNNSKSVLLLKGLTSKEDMFQQLNCFHAEIVEVEIEVVSPSIVPSGNFAELNRTVTCMVLMANDRRTSSPCNDEFRGPRSVYVRQFQQDGATCHTARATIDLLKDTFGDRLISRFGPVNWPPRSCDLTPLDYFLWGYVKSLVYADKPQTLDHLEDNIRRVIADIRPQMLEKVIENWTSRLDYIRASRGSSMPEFIFKM
ncbi:hypothetical protein TNCV_45861 [Trichonephila clavipes]|nr:hypothetical protein TNCV_45861 [Trichonephila clavipes]